MSTTFLQPGIHCLRLRVSPSGATMLSQRFSSASAARLHFAQQTARPVPATKAVGRLVQRQSAASASTSASASSAAAAGTTARVSMPWEEYFKCRKSRRTYGTIAAIPTTLAGCIIGGGYFANLQSDPNQLILGIEPIWVYSIAIVGCVGLGWLSGPVLGNGLWRFTHRSVLKQVEEMDGIFLQHIKARRADPSRQSVNNPVPDYYGEKIGSKKGYRQWLRDQATYRRKAEFGAAGL